MAKPRQYPIVYINEKAERSLRAGHPWVYGEEVTHIAGEYQNGDIVDVFTSKNRYLGSGFINNHSKILVRVISDNTNDRFDDAFFERRLRYAVDYRRTVMPGDDFKCCRLIFGEADQFPGLTVDRFDNILSVQIARLGIDLRREMLLNTLVRILREYGQKIDAVYIRNDPAFCEKEGMEAFEGFFVENNTAAASDGCFVKDRPAATGDSCFAKDGLAATGDGCVAKDGLAATGDGCFAKDGLDTNGDGCVAKDRPDTNGAAATFTEEGLDAAGMDGTIIVENGIRYHVDFKGGQKTGFFLDQKYNRAAVARLAKGRKVLDCFTHTGAFALNAAAAGAKSVTAVDVSADAIRMAQANAQLNGLSEKITFLCEDVFALLTNMAQNGQKDYDLIILDPPAFTKSRRTIQDAQRGYKEINRKAMQLLPRGGYLATCSCSHFMTEGLFKRMLHDAASDAGVRLRQIEARQQSPDHPILWGVPETYYLKFFIFQVV